jgi:DNA-binding beta-propeller fold protein YncE
MTLRLAAFLLAVRCLSPGAIVTSIAGLGPSQRDAIAAETATAATLGEVHALFVDPDGGLLIGAQRLLVRLTPQGRTEALAGPGTLNFGDGLAGDPVPAEHAPIVYLRGVARAADGEVYFSDAGMHSVRKIGTDGLVRTVVPSSANYFSPRALVFDSTGNLYFAALGLRGDTTLRGVIVKVTPAGQIMPLAIRNAKGTLLFLNQPEGLAIDASGALYVTEFGGHRVLRIAGDAATILAGTGHPGMSGDGGPAQQAELNAPSGVTVLPDGTVLIADTMNNRIRSVSPNGIIDTLHWTIAGQTDHRVSAPAHIRFDPARQAIYVAEYFGRRVSRIEAGRMTFIAGNGHRLTPLGGTGEGGPALLATLTYPEGIAACNGVIYVADTSNFLVRAIDHNGSIHSVAGTGSAPGPNEQGGIATGTPMMPTAVACDGAGNLYVADRGRPRIWRVDTDGTATALLGDGTFTNPELRDVRGIAVDRARNVFVAERSLSRILQIAPDGRTRVVWSGRQGFDFPKAVAVDPHDRLHFSINAAPEASTVRRVELDGSITVVAGSGEPCDDSAVNGAATQTDLCFVSGLAFDSLGRLLLSTNDRIARVDSDGSLQWIAGAGEREPGAGLPWGDHGPAMAARLNGISGIAVDDRGIYLTQLLVNRVRRIH